ncbi:hypothetical protein ACJJTC_002439 [Scirpophaga incertulas]
MDDINTEEFINETEIHFQNKTTGEKNSAAMVLQKKWRHIRDAYARDLKKQRESKSGSEAKTKRKYVYFYRLQFLSELYETKPDSKGKNNQTGDAATASTSKITVMFLRRSPWLNCCQICYISSIQTHGSQKRFQFRRLVTDC